MADRALGRLGRNIPKDFHEAADSGAADDRTENDRTADGRRPAVIDPNRRLHI
jgi:hypothetical protein